MTVSPVLLDIMRHGEVTGKPAFNGVSDPVLTEMGWRSMAVAAAKSLRADAIVTSPLMRCAAFAEDWGRKQRIPVRVEPDLREYDFGRWDGRSVDEIMAMDPELLAAFWRDPLRNPPPEGESMVSFQQRIASVFAALFHSSIEGHVLVITHGGVMRQFVSEQLNCSFTASWSLDIPLGSLLRVVCRPRSCSDSGELLFLGMA
ncbi:MAG: histidine phosphatase family protein [Magnetococcales bacterium]|nr:histidine phosphatase family protein [Magnetococcales bacterium]